MTLQKTALILLIWGLGVMALPPLTLAQSYVPPDRGLPGRREGGGTRGGCISSQPTLTALMPEANFGQTTQAYPTLFWYVPETQAVAAEFELLDQHNQQIYLVEIPLSEQPGVIGIRLPEQDNASGLAIGQTYHWYFSLICDRQDRSGDVTTEGWIERQAVGTELHRQLEAAMSGDRTAIYAASGLWYDALDELVSLRMAQPGDEGLLQQWSNLLTSVNLGTLANQPLLMHSPESIPEVVPAPSTPAPGE